MRNWVWVLGCMVTLWVATVKPFAEAGKRKHTPTDTQATQETPPLQDPLPPPTKRLRTKRINNRR